MTGFPSESFSRRDCMARPNLSERSTRAARSRCVRLLRSAVSPRLTLALVLQKNDGLEQLGISPAGNEAWKHWARNSIWGPDAFLLLLLPCIMNFLYRVICRDTAIAHLAGALGRPVWIAPQTRPGLALDDRIGRTRPGIRPRASSGKAGPATGMRYSSASHRPSLRK